MMSHQSASDDENGSTRSFLSYITRTTEAFDDPNQFLMSNELSNDVKPTEINLPIYDGEEDDYDDNLDVGFLSVPRSEFLRRGELGEGSLSDGSMSSDGNNRRNQNIAYFKNSRRRLTAVQERAGEIQGMMQNSMIKFQDSYPSLPNMKTLKSLSTSKRKLLTDQERDIQHDVIPEEESDNSDIDCDNVHSTKRKGHLRQFLQREHSIKNNEFVEDEESSDIESNYLDFPKERCDRQLDIQHDVIPEEDSENDSSESPRNQPLHEQHLDDSKITTPINKDEVKESISKYDENNSNNRKILGMDKKTFSSTSTAPTAHTSSEGSQITVKSDSFYEPSRKIHIIYEDGADRGDSVLSDPVIPSESRIPGKQRLFEFTEALRSSNVFRFGTSTTTSTENTDKQQDVITLAKEPHESKPRRSFTSLLSRKSDDPTSSSVVADEENELLNSVESEPKIATPLGSEKSSFLVSNDAAQPLDKNDSVSLKESKIVEEKKSEMNFNNEEQSHSSSLISSHMDSKSRSKTKVDASDNIMLKHQNDSSLPKDDSIVFHKNIQRNESVNDSTNEEKSDIKNTTLEDVNDEFENNLRKLKKNYEHLLKPDLKPKAEHIDDDDTLTLQSVTSNISRKLKKNYEHLLKSDVKPNKTENIDDDDTLTLQSVTSNISKKLKANYEHLLKSDVIKPNKTENIDYEEDDDDTLTLQSVTSNISKISNYIRDEVKTIPTFISKKSKRSSLNKSTSRSLLTPEDGKSIPSVISKRSFKSATGSSSTLGSVKRHGRRSSDYRKGRRMSTTYHPSSAESLHSSFASHNMQNNINDSNSVVSMSSSNSAISHLLQRRNSSHTTSSKKKASLKPSNSRKVKRLSTTQRRTSTRSLHSSFASHNIQNDINDSNSVVSMSSSNSALSHLLQRRNSSHSVLSKRRGMRQSSSHSIFSSKKRASLKSLTSTKSTAKNNRKEEDDVAFFGWGDEDDDFEDADEQGAQQGGHLLVQALSGSDSEDDVLVDFASNSSAIRARAKRIETMEQQMEIEYDSKRPWRKAPKNDYNSATGSAENHTNPDDPNNNTNNSPNNNNHRVQHNNVLDSISDDGEVDFAVAPGFFIQSEVMSVVSEASSIQLAKSALNVFENIDALSPHDDLDGLLEEEEDVEDGYENIDLNNVANVEDSTRDVKKLAVENLSSSSESESESSDSENDSDDDDDDGGGGNSNDDDGGGNSNHDDSSKQKNIKEQKKMPDEMSQSKLKIAGGLRKLKAALLFKTSVESIIQQRSNTKVIGSSSSLSKSISSHTGLSKSISSRTGLSSKMDSGKKSSVDLPNVKESEVLNNNNKDDEDSDDSATTSGSDSEYSEESHDGEEDDKLGDMESNNIRRKKTKMGDYESVPLVEQREKERSEKSFNSDRENSCYSFASMSSRNFSVQYSDPSLEENNNKSRTRRKLVKNTLGNSVRKITRSCTPKKNKLKKFPDHNKKKFRKKGMIERCIGPCLWQFRCTICFVTCFCVILIGGLSYSYYYLLTENHKMDMILSEDVSSLLSKNDTENTDLSTKNNTSFNITNATEIFSTNITDTFSNMNSTNTSSTSALNTTMIEEASTSNATTAEDIMRDTLIMDEDGWVSTLEKTAAGNLSGLVMEGLSYGDRYGSSVSLSDDGSILAVGARFDKSTFSDDTTTLNTKNNIGYVKIYVLRDGNYVESSTLNGVGLLPNSQFGWTVSLSGNGKVLAVGARTALLSSSLSSSKKINIGLVRVFHQHEDNDDLQSDDRHGKYLRKRVRTSKKRSDSNSIEWKMIGSDIIGENSGDLEGFSIALSKDGSRLASGAVGYDYRNTIGETGGLVEKQDVGRVRVFEYEPFSNVWNQMGQTLYGLSPHDMAGRSLSLSKSGDVVAYGAWNGKSDKGAVHVYNLKESNGQWVQRGESISDLFDDDASIDGMSVSLSGDGSAIAVGSVGNDQNPGQCRVFKWFEGGNNNLSSSSWVQLGDVIKGEQRGEKLGYSVELSSNGDRVAVSSDYNLGVVRLYDLRKEKWNLKVSLRPSYSLHTPSSGTGFVDLKKIMTNEEEEELIRKSSYFGHSLAFSMNASMIAVGAPGAGYSLGKVYVYKYRS